jgi:antitoxin (DNA-binding transcriptional repressor) of toxin-antitoxin stability system
MTYDHGRSWLMETMAISKFKATCLATLERVRRTGRPLRVTRFGKPVADIVPPSPERRPPEWLGSLRGTVEVTGDIVAPSGDLARWDALR